MFGEHDRCIGNINHLNWWWASFSPTGFVCVRVGPHYTILVTTFPEWLSDMEPLHTHPALCVRPPCVCSVLRAHVQLCQFDKVDATADVQWHCNHQPPLWYHYFPAPSSLGADILVYWIGKIVQTALDFLRARQAPYPLGQALRYWYFFALGNILYIVELKQEVMS